MTILITGATGQVGGATARALVARGRTVRALVREPARAVAALAGVECVAGSFDDAAALARALAGVDALLLTGRDGPDTVAQQLNVLECAWRAGVRRIVKLSAIGAAAASKVELMRDHHAVDERLRAGPAAWTLLKPHLFMQNLTRAAEVVRRDGLLSAPLGDGRVPLVDTRDVGVAAAVVLADPTAHARREYRLTGPAPLGYGEVAVALAALVHRPVRYEAVPPIEYEARLLAAGVPAWRAFDLAHIAAAYGPADQTVSPDFEALTGRGPTSLADFLSDYRVVFTGAAAPA